MAKKKDGPEWIAASEASKRLAKENMNVSAPHLGKIASTGAIERKRQGNKWIYPWPKVKEQYSIYKENNPIGEKATQVKNVEVKAEEAKDTWNTERIINALERGVPGAELKALQWAKSVNELISVKKNQIALLELEGKTISRQEVEDFIFRHSRANRDVWLNWPQEVAASMAEELKVDGKLMNDVLLKFVRKRLERNATMPLNLDGDHSE